MARLADFLAHQSPKAADPAASALSQATRSLARIPERGRPGPGAPLREPFVAFGLESYVIQDQADATIVVVARFYHGREDP